MIIEIRPGEGGDDALNFSRELSSIVLNMVKNHAEKPV